MEPGTVPFHIEHSTIFIPMPTSIPEVHDYPASYYAASRNQSITAPTLKHDLTAGVCVIGGGFSGLATALFLAEQGRSVVLLEANRIGWGASGRNGGQIVSGYGEDTESLMTKLHGHKSGERAWQLGFDCIEILNDTIQRHNIQCDLTWGYVRAAMTRRQEKQLRRMVTHWEQREAPGSANFVERADVKSLIGTSAYRAAVHTDCEGHLHPLNLALGEAKAIVSQGGQVFENSPVTNITNSQDNGPITITTPGGNVTADALVFAGNAYLEKLEPRLQSTLI